jgi:ubiquinol-cytochrome c reductase cytochrome b subunit
MAPCSTPGEAQTFQISRLPPVDGPIAYRGSYRLLDGVTMSQAYQAVVAISLDLHGGLLIRQVHHWSADLFAAAICLRLLRAFFRGRFSARALPGWLIWVVLLPWAC